MNDEAYQRLSRIDDELMRLCRWLNEKRDIETASRLLPITNELTLLVAELSVKRDDAFVLSPVAVLVIDFRSSDLPDASIN